VIDNLKKLNPLPSFVEVVAKEKLLERAHSFYRADPRARALADSCTVLALTNYGEIDPEDVRRAAREIAFEAAMFTITRIYFEDAEVAALRAERDRWKEIAERAVMISSPAFVSLRDSDTHPKDGDAKQGSARE
jgi:hypothetical protein